MFIFNSLLAAMTLTVHIDMSVEPWRSVNDGVMGGLSAGRMVPMEEHLRFEGVLSLENNGGFASVRRLIEQDLTSAESVRLHLRGDGREYQFRLRLDDRWDGIAWRAKIETTGEWQIIDLALVDFDPVFRGRKVADAGAVVAASVRQIGFMLADKQAGPFRLEIRSIEFR